MINKKVIQLHLTVIEAADKVKSIIKNHENQEDEMRTLREKFSDSLFEFGSSSRFVFLFAAIVIGWVVYNIAVPASHRPDGFPFPLMGFILAAVAAIQAPIIMMSQHRQNHKANRRIALDLKVDNEILSLHRSIVLLMEQQIQQVHENQVMTIKLLEELHRKSDSKA